MEENATPVKCPVCGGTLEDGFLQGSHRLSFVKKFRFLKYNAAKGDFLLPFTFPVGTYFPAQYCETCDTITISLKED